MKEVVAVNVGEIQEALGREKLDGWLFFDHHQRDPLAYRVLGFAPASHVTRRWYYFIPAKGEPRGTGAPDRIENAGRSAGREDPVLELDRADGRAAQDPGRARGAWRCSIRRSARFRTWRWWTRGRWSWCAGWAWRWLTSAELIQYFEARWTKAALESHLEAGRRVDRVRGEAFAMIGERTRNGAAVEELEVEAIRAWTASRKQGLVTADGPIVGVNANAANPHYEPQEGATKPIRRGDFVLLDMWAKLDQPGVGVLRHHVDGILRDGAAGGDAQGFRDRARGAGPCGGARAAGDAGGASAYADSKWTTLRAVTSRARGTGRIFVHRTGHSIGQDVHGNGANMDNLETHDERRIVPWTCFSMEPGIYLQDFGVRSGGERFRRRSMTRG